MAENPRWVNQYAYDITWCGRRTRVFIKRLRPMIVSDALLRETAVNLGTLIRKAFRR